MVIQKVKIKLEGDFDDLDAFLAGTSIASILSVTYIEGGYLLILYT